MTDDLNRVSFRALHGIIRRVGVGLCVAMGWLSVCLAHADVPAKQPNVILVMSDDQGFGDFSCHGNPVLKTPHLDRLHDQSARFTDFHVAPMCTPTRAELMTGIDTLRSGAMNVCQGRTLLRRELPTMANLFAAAGYRTGLFGKWHLGDTYPYRPNDRGFEQSLWFHSAYLEAAADVWDNDYFNDIYHFDDEPRRVKGYCTDVFFDEAIKWIEQRHKNSEPFFAYIPTNTPHGPYYVPARYRKQYDKALADKPLDARYRKRLARYFGMVANLDDNIGRLEKMLEETGLRNNTIVIFLTDNGGTGGTRFFNADMRGHKTQLWEGGHRVPCFIRWPAGGIDDGRDVDNLTECQDLLPTLIDLCGLKIPAGATFDGMSLAGLLRGEKKPFPDRILVVQYSRMNVGRLRALGGRPQKNDAAVLWRKWRLLRGKELYNLSADPHQDTNVIDKHPELAERLQRHYDRWWKEIDPTLDTFQPLFIGTEAQNPTRLCAADWADSFLGDRAQVRRGTQRNGLWHVEVARPGRYRFALRRWPRELATPIVGSSPPHQGEDEACRHGPGKALAIAKARLRVGQHDLEKEVAPDDREATFTVTLPKGRTTVETWFRDKQDKELCGAYYVYVERLADER